MNRAQHKQAILDEEKVLVNLVCKLEASSSATKILLKNLLDKWEGYQHPRKDDDVYVHGIYHFDFEMTLEEFTEEGSHEAFGEFISGNAELIYNYERSKELTFITHELVQSKIKELV